MILDVDRNRYIPRPGTNIVKKDKTKQSFGFYAIKKGTPGSLVV